MAKPHRINFYLPDWLVTRAKSKAKGEARTLSAVVRLLLAAWVAGRLKLPRRRVQDKEV